MSFYQRICKIINISLKKYRNTSRYKLMITSSVSAWGFCNLIYVLYLISICYIYGINQPKYVHCLHTKVLCYNYLCTLAGSVFLCISKDCISFDIYFKNLRLQALLRMGW